MCVRDKTLSFGCYISSPSWIFIERKDKSTFNYYDINCDSVWWWNLIKYKHRTNNIEYWKNIEIIWHSINWWRIEHVYMNVDKEKRFDRLFIELKHQMFKWIVDNNLIDQSELERQTHEKRPELKSLLMQFSNYL